MGAREILICMKPLMVLRDQSLQLRKVGQNTFNDLASIIDAKDLVRGMVGMGGTTRRTETTI